MFTARVRQTFRSICSWGVNAPVYIVLRSVIKLS